MHASTRLTSCVSPTYKSHELHANRHALPGTEQATPGQAGSIPGTEQATHGQAGSIPGTEQATHGQAGSVPGTE